MVIARRLDVRRTLVPLAAMWAALLAGALAAVLTGALWLLVVGVVLSIVVPPALRARQPRRRYQRVAAWIFGVMLALLVLWVVMIVIAIATGQIE
jgi:NADH:ubiquinone oxidoreductase subunit 6 (subunit J)